MRWSAFGVYVGAVILAGIAVVVGALTLQPPSGIAGSDPVLFAIFAAMLVVSEIKPITWLRRRESVVVTASLAYAGALMFLSPGYGAAVVFGVASAIGDLASRRPVVKLAFNAAMVVVSMAAGIFVLDLTPYREELIGGGPLHLPFLPMVALASIAIFTVNGLAIAVVVALQERTRIIATIRRDFTINMSTDGILLAMGPVLVVVAQRSLVLLPMLLLVSYAVFRSARMALERQHEATHDALTGLPNRRLFKEQVESTIQQAAKRSNRPAVVLLDLDGFKEINDRLGHHVGDLVLQQIGKRLSEAVRASDMVARLGGDEFAILLGGVADEAMARLQAERLCSLVTQPLQVNGFPLTVGGSFGVALFPDHGEEVSALLRHADVAMYMAKNQGGGVVSYTSDVGDRSARGRISLLQEINGAMDREEFLLHYQPKVDLQTGGVIGFEALLRWEHPNLGMVPPDEFIPLAEQTDLIEPLTEYVLQRALEECARWHDRGYALSVAVNLSARNLHDLRFPRTVARLLRETGVGAEWLELELTENTVLADPTRTAQVLRDLRALGATLAIDDFGTGYSSLANLRELPVQSVKIDKSFVREMLTNQGDAVIVNAIVELGRHLGLHTVAEGIETMEIVTRLATLGCNSAQGYHIARPMPGRDVVPWLRSRAASFVPVAARVEVAS